MTHKSDIKVFPTLNELSWAAAYRLENLARFGSLGGKKVFSLALSGGHTPRLLCEILASDTMAGRIRWENVHIFQVDERPVPPDHPDSNYGMIREALLNHIAIPEKNVHRLPGERADCEEACRQYAIEISRTLKVPEREWPRFDMVFLGMGPDGHTASLFPGTEALEEKVLWVRPNYVEKMRTHRLTLTLPVLNAAADVVFLVAGADKAETVHQVLEGPPEQLPAQRVQPSNGRVNWFLDGWAAQKLSPALRG
jgi:6-phosphogluconolactonase